MARSWIWVSVPYATVALIVRDGIVVDAPPIARWAKGKKEGEVLAYYRKKTGVLIEQFELPEWQGRLF